MSRFRIIAKKRKIPCLGSDSGVRAEARLRRTHTGRPTPAEPLTTRVKLVPFVGFFLFKFLITFCGFPALDLGMIRLPRHVHQSNHPSTEKVRVGEWLSAESKPTAQPEKWIREVDIIRYQPGLQSKEVEVVPLIRLK